MKDIDWSKAPEGATHYDISSDVYPWIKEDDNGNKFWHHNEWVKYSKSISEAEGCIAKPKPQPVYTQAMCDAGELPQVGMECMVKRFHEQDNLFQPCFIVGKNKQGDYLVFERGGKLDQHNIANGVWEFKPIDQRTNKEKAIDDINKYIKGTNGLVLAKNVFSYIEENKIHGVKWVGE